MFAHIHGWVDDVQPDRAVLEAAGVGYEILCSTATLKTLDVGMEAKLYIHFHQVQDTVTLYGFASKEERAMFRRLIGVSRVGPKLALGMLSHLEVSDIAAAILTENAAALSRVPGLGKKTAARLLLELKEQVSEDVAPTGVFAGESKALDMRAEATAALVALGYDGVVAGRAVAETPDCPRVEDMITAALRSLAAKK